jgi:lysophospholipid acyltransferase (LPLAT)-like uncharacterized protein
LSGRSEFWFRIGVSCAAYTVPVIVRGLVGSCQVTRQNAVLLDRVRRGEAFVGAFWHEDLLSYASLFRHLGFAVLISRSRDGEIGTRIVRRLGFRPVRGSSSRGAEEALRELVELARSGVSVGFAIDGPRGPRHEAKIGPVVAAKLSGRPIVPIACAIRRAIRLDNWDRSRIPLPFTRIVARAGDPIPVAPDASRAECECVRQRLQDEIVRLEALAAAALGRDTDHQS